MNFREWNLVFAWVIALAGTLMSLFYTVIALSDPCPLCWYQRIALFPLSVQLGIAAYRRDESFCLYAYPLCFFGLAVALYQSILPALPNLQKSCGIHENCTTRLPEIFGIPFPWVSALGFLLIALLLRMSRFGSVK